MRKIANTETGRRFVSSSSRRSTIGRSVQEHHQPSKSRSTWFVCLIVLPVLLCRPPALKTNSPAFDVSSRRVERSVPGRRIPVYVYDLPAVFEAALPLRHRVDESDADIWALWREKKLVSYVPWRSDNDASTGTHDVQALVDTKNDMLLWPHILRFLRSGLSARFRLCENGTETDLEGGLFLVPLFPYPISYKNLFRYCDTASVLESASRTLSFLTKKNARRHLILLAKPLQLSGRYCDPWWRDAIVTNKSLVCQHQHPLCEAQRFSYSASYRAAGRPNACAEPGRWKSRSAKGVVCIPYHRHRAPWFFGGVSPEQRAFFPDGRVVSIPYPSSVLVDQSSSSENPPFAGVLLSAASAPSGEDLSSRPFLVSYIGKPHGLQGQVRKNLERLCRLEKKKCQLGDTSSGEEKNFLAAKQTSVFCLEPEGDTPDRKSIYDSLSSGCIPVYFSPVSAQLAPAHLGGWGENASLLLDPSDFGLTSSTPFSSKSEDGSDGGATRVRKKNLFQFLESIPATEVRSMQRLIRENAYKLQYGLWKNGAVDRLLEFAHRRAADNPPEEPD